MRILKGIVAQHPTANLMNEGKHSAISIQHSAFKGTRLTKVSSWLFYS